MPKHTHDYASCEQTIPERSAVRLVVLAPRVRLHAKGGLWMSLFAAVATRCATNSANKETSITVVGGVATARTVIAWSTPACDNYDPLWENT